MKKVVQGYGADLTSTPSKLPLKLQNDKLQNKLDLQNKFNNQRFKERINNNKNDNNDLDFVNDKQNTN